MWDFFKFYLDLELFVKIKIDLVSTHSFFTLTYIFFLHINNSRSKQNKRNPTHRFGDNTKQKTCAKFQQKILKFMVVGAHQSFQFFRQKSWFLENSRGLP